MIRVYRQFLTILFAIGTFMFSGIASSFEIQIASSGDRVRWKESCFYYTLHEDGSDNIPMEALRKAIRASFDTWEDVDCSYFYFEETEEDATCSPIGFDLKKSNMNLLVWREDDWHVDSDHDRSVMALTTLSYDDKSGRILDADIEFNGEIFDFSVDGEAGMADIQNTATHEIGHTIGLEHTSNRDATMAPTAETGDTDKRTLHKDDINGICELYPIESDPNICKEPYCGLDQHCQGSTCETGDGIETNPATMTEPTTGCTTSGVVGKGDRRFFSMIAPLLLTFIQ